jgi:hypothetical protein
MTVIYRTAGAWGGGQGSDLSAAQIDGNFYTIDLAVAAKAATGAGVAHMTVVSNNQLQTQLTDGTYLPPVTLPTATFTFRGQWLPDTVYSANDIITEDGSVYLVLLGHTSAGTFDPGANNGSGADFYGLLLSLPADVIPAGGSTGEVLTKVSGTDFDVAWEPVGGPSGAPVQTKTGTTFTPALTDAGTYNRLTNASGCTVHIPDDAAVAFSIGTEIHFRQANPAGMSFVGSSPVVLNGVTGYLDETAAEGATCTLKKVATDTWDLFGLLEPMSGA